MRTIQTKTLALRYHPKEDRMKLVLNQNKENAIEYWITRRLYLSLLFDLDTYLESIGMDKEVPSTYKKDKEQKPTNDKVHSSSSTEAEKYLLTNIKLNIGEKRKRFFIVFYSDSIECETFITKDAFLNFYAMMKNTFPKKEWGII